MRTASSSRWIVFVRDLVKLEDAREELQRCLELLDDDLRGPQPHQLVDGGDVSRAHQDAGGGIESMGYRDAPSLIDRGGDGEDHYARVLDPDALQRLLLRAVTEKDAYTFLSSLPHHLTVLLERHVGQAGSLGALEPGAFR